MLQNINGFSQFMNVLCQSDQFIIDEAAMVNHGDPHKIYFIIALRKHHTVQNLNGFSKFMNAL